MAPPRLRPARLPIIYSHLSNSVLVLQTGPFRRHAGQNPPLCLPLNILHSLLMRRLRGCYDKHGELYILKRLSHRKPRL